MNTSISRRLSIPPYIIIGALLILLPIFIFVTLQNIKRQQANTTFLLLEKGAALIRSFEAGTRAGMRGRLWGNRKLQQLLEETAQQPDIAYLIVADDEGTILAHSDITQLGKKHGAGLDMKKVAISPDLLWRVVNLGDNKRIFEVFRQFIPTGVPGNPAMQGRMLRQQGRAVHNGPRNIGEGAQVIFIALDMSSLDEATNATINNSILTGILLFLAGSAGIVLLFLYQNYRSTRTSLSRIKAFSDNLVNNMPIGLLALDTDKNITAANIGAEEILGLSQKEMMGKPVSGVLPGNLLGLLNRIELAGKVIGEELPCTIKPGRITPLEISLSIIKDEQERSIGYAFLFKDLSEIHELRKEVARSQRLASIGRLAAGVAHEIRNPLSSIKGFATYFRERYKTVQKDQQIANIMISEVERLDRVVGQLLELARPVKIVVQETNLADFLQNSARLIEQKIAEKNISVQFHLPDEPCNFGIDRDKLNQVLLNLYLNAIDAMEPEGTLELGLNCHPTERKATITVADSGHGIPEHHLTKIFDPYFTTKSTGTGLGLAIVHNILEAHQGTIRAENRSQNGVVFTITIPDLTKETTDAT
ncbi:PAS domain S-box protein [bacterium]|nr:PAS domain S-box protein [bacterium]